MRFLILVVVIQLVPDQKRHALRACMVVFNYGAYYARVSLRGAGARI